MNFWPMMQNMLSPEETGNSAKAPGPARGTATLKPLPADALIIVPLRNAVLFPGVMSPITIGRASSVAAAQEAARAEKRVGFLLQRDPDRNKGGPDDLHWVGTAGPGAGCLPPKRAPPPGPRGGARRPPAPHPS